LISRVLFEHLDLAQKLFEVQNDALQKALHPFVDQKISPGYCSVYFMRGMKNPGNFKFPIGLDGN
jgi:hypothetical protein